MAREVLSLTVMAREVLSLTEIITMLAPRESFYPFDASIVITLDIEDSPVAEFPLTELFDIASSTIVENYLEVLQEYVTQIIEDTTWLDMQSKLCLVRARFCVYQRKSDDTLYTMRKPSLQRLINQTLRCSNGTHCPIEVHLFIRLRDSKIKVPRKTRFPVALALASNVHSFHPYCSASPYWSFVADNENLSSINSDGLALGLNESANASAVDEGNSAIGHIPHAVKKDTDDHESHDGISMMTLDFDALSTDGNGFVYGSGLDTGFNNKDQNIDDLASNELADVCVVAKNRTGSMATVTTVTNVCGASPISMGAIVHRSANTRFLHYEDWEMLPKGETTQKQYQITLTAMQLLLHRETAAMALQQGVPIHRNLLMYHPIDRGRCILPFFRPLSITEVNT